MTTTTDQCDRLKQAREAAGFASAEDAARALGVKAVTYHHHENGTNGLSRAGERYARFFHVRYDWLMTGKGPMLDETALALSGYVGAGATVNWDDDAKITDADVVWLPQSSDLRAFKVKGDSQYPRFLDGEVVLAERKPAVPAEVIGQYAVIQTDDGRVLIKILRRSAAGGELFRLESHNAPAEENVRVEFAWRYVGVLPRASAKAPAVARSKPSRLRVA